MSFSRIFCAAFLLVFCLGGPTLAQDAVPAHRYLYERDVDFYGADLGKLFDTSRDACERACSAQQGCTAFTFNTRSNACFPKAAVTDGQSYVGAISARKLPVNPAILAGVAGRQIALGFLDATDLSEARARAEAMAWEFAADGATLEELLDALQQSQQDDQEGQIQRLAGRAAVLSGRADLWTRFGAASLMQAAQNEYDDSTADLRDALTGAVNGYLRATEVAVQVEALSVLAQALEANGRGTAMIPALRLALTLGAREDLAAQLDAAIGKYGFRVVDNTVDNNAAAPRICAEFSEKLAQGGVDFEPFVRVEGRGLVVQVDDRQLCLDGVEHGQRYELTLRAGLPAESGETLAKDVRLQVYVRDRAPSVRFSGRAYVLPRAADAAVPVETINTDTLNLTLNRVSDRNLVRAIRDSYFGKPLNTWEEDQFSDTLAQQIWSGSGDVQNTLNAEMTTRLPLGDVLAGQTAGIYVLTAAVPGQDRYEFPAASQWFVLSDLGLSTWSGTDGLHVAVRGLADASAREGVKLTLISRANAVLGTAVTGADGFTSFEAGLTRGEGGGGTCFDPR